MPRLEGRIKLRHFTDCTKTVDDVLSRWSPSKCLTYKVQFYDWAKEVLKEARQIFRTSNQQKTINKLFSSFAFVSFRAQSLFLSFFRVFDISKKNLFFWPEFDSFLLPIFIYSSKRDVRRSQSCNFSCKYYLFRVPILWYDKHGSFFIYMQKLASSVSILNDMQCIDSLLFVPNHWCVYPIGCLLATKRDKY